MNQPEVTIIAGPNGSGKTTFALEFLKESKVPFLNADEIAKKMSSDNLELVQLKAGKEYFRQLKELISSKKSFAFESTLSGKSTEKVLRDLKSLEFKLRIIYLYLENPNVCMARVAERVKQGGHHVPDEDVVRRYSRSKNNFWWKYKNMVDQWTIYYNSNDNFEEVAFGNSDNFEIVNQDYFDGFSMGVAHD